VRFCRRRRGAKRSSSGSTPAHVVRHRETRPRRPRHPCDEAPGREAGSFESEAAQPEAQPREQQPEDDGERRLGKRCPTS
jgi:hypothetical protein